MKERASWPMKGWEVRAILAGSRTQKRLAFNERTMKLMRAAASIGEVSWFMDEGYLAENDLSYILQFCPYGQPGDRLWVRESGAMHPIAAPEDPAQPWLFRHDVPAIESLGHYWVQRTRSPGASYSAECKREQFLRHAGAKVVPSIHMPRWASRILLEIVSVRVERLQDISEADARAEGISDGGCLNCGESEPCGCSNPQPDARDSFFHLWMSINGEQSLHENPWVWAIEFKRVTP